MGCDIHSYVEVKQANGTWHAPLGFQTDSNRPYPEIYEDAEYTTNAPSPVNDRNYDLFGFLAGVRRDTTPALTWLGIDGGWGGYSHLRGLPEDMAGFTATEWEAWHEDGHSASWLTIAELKHALVASMIVGEAEYFSESLQWSIAQIEHATFPTPPEDVRLVFWFDN